MKKLILLGQKGLSMSLMSRAARVSDKAVTQRTVP